MKRTRRLRRSTLIIFAVCIAAYVVEYAIGIRQPKYDSAQYWANVLNTGLVVALWYFEGRRDEARRQDREFTKLMTRVRQQVKR